MSKIRFCFFFFYFSGQRFQVALVGLVNSGADNINTLVLVGQEWADRLFSPSQFLDKKVVLSLTTLCYLFCVRSELRPF